MQINNEILNDFIHCRHKAYRKSKQQKGIISDYEILYDQLKQAQKIEFEKSLSHNARPTFHQMTLHGTIPKEGIALDFNFKNENIDLTITELNSQARKNSFYFLLHLLKRLRGWTNSSLLCNPLSFKMNLAFR